MPLKKSLFSLLILTTLTACQPAGKSAVNQVPQQDAIPALSKENVGDFENYSMLSTQDEWKIIAWSGKAVSQPGNKIKGEISSTVSILKREKQAWRVISQKQFADSYNPACSYIPNSLWQEKQSSS
ncbi:hypothetical protein UNDKW_1214 [Undibacterium sp. KW1]|uniref:hypothetical protein n=1 Tax=Undibacterium sp. KW1 TaxID=2058624 RepID=UPI001331D043|nr:hypothetical protein [Undibacterium sp. KW1]BBB59487.1 hypothetical protein UNDKW_1214 [Undibacterium sp. KW1]